MDNAWTFNAIDDGRRMHRGVLFRSPCEGGCKGGLPFFRYNPLCRYCDISPSQGSFPIITSHSQRLEVMKECIHERSLSSVFTWSWMSINTSILVNDGKILILEDDIERNILGNEFHGFDFPLYLYHISSVDFLVFGEVFSISRDFSFFYHFLDIAAGFFGKKSRQVSVDSSGFTFICENAEERCGIIVGTSQ